MLSYKDYEKKIYDWLISKNKIDPNFTFSVRRNGTKGAKTDYFIGTEKSKYFATTFWEIPVGFPGSSSDCIDLIFGFDQDNYSYKIEFTQTNSPHNQQNTSALNLIKSLREPISSNFGLKYVSGSDKKMFSLIPNTPKEKYASIDDMLVDVEKDLDIIIPLVDEYIEKEKEKNPEFVAHRITPDEFEKMQEKMARRIEKYSNIDENINDVSDQSIEETRLINRLRKIGYRDTTEFYSLLEYLLSHLKVDLGDQRICYNLPKDNKLIGITIGQKYCLNVEFINKKNVFGYIDTSKEEKSWYKKANSLKELNDAIEIIKESSIKELEKTNKTGYGISSSTSLEKSIYDKNYRQLIFSKAFTGENLIIDQIKYPLNQILYGPPGTGKTYYTILKAAEIIENRTIEDFNEAKRIFNKHLGKRIEFITFHQNYSYEDFIQGLRPDTENDKELTFEKKDGIFKVIADKALKNIRESEEPTSIKKPFNEVFNSFFANLNEGEVEELEIPMKKVSYFVTGISNKSISFRKASGGTEHTLSISTLKKMYDAESILDIQGLSSYYSPLLSKLLTLGKISNGEKEKVEKQNFVIVIDEINRANISRVFGELITLIEKDKRSNGDIPLKCTLPSGEEFVVPSNLYIIGTMNTADKSIALLDIALRRRFEFESMYPKYEIEGEEIYDVEILKKINKKIIDLKGHDFQIGHAYFMGENNNLIHRMNKKVIPLLLEYFMNDEKEVKSILTHAGLELEENAWPLKVTGIRA